MLLGCSYARLVVHENLSAKPIDLECHRKGMYNSSLSSGVGHAVVQIRNIHEHSANC